METPNSTPPHRTVSAIFKNQSDALDSLRKHGSKPGGPAVVELEFAATLLLVELASSDHNYSRSEHLTIFNGIKRLFGCSPEKAEALISEARAYLQSPLSTSQFSSLLRDHVSELGRKAIIDVVDQVVEADGLLEGVELYVRNKFVRQLGLTEIVAPLTGEAGPLDKKTKSGNAPPDRSRIKNDDWP